MEYIRDRPALWQATVAMMALGLSSGCDEIAPPAEAHTLPIAMYDTTVKSGVTTRYWDCCKPSFTWPGKAAVNAPVTACQKNGVTSIAANTPSGCNGGSAYACNSNQPWSVNSELSYGFAAAKLAGLGEADIGCACYELKFTSGAVKGKTMVVQVVNTAGDLGSNHFSLQIPGGGVEVFTSGCSSQWGTPSTGWGAQYGGVSKKSACSQLPSQLQPGCNWRFDWFKNADNPTVKFRRVKCPAAITAKSGCKRNDE